ncbi:MAG TPA: FlgO family outer membrane protein, partial [Phenylobacterium sp.]
QLVANRLAQRGYQVRDLTYMRALAVVPNTGEIVLSRDASKILAQANAQAVVAGSYAVGGRQIYLSLRLLRADDGQLLSSADVVLPLDHDTEYLVGVPMMWTRHDAPVGSHAVR